MRLAFAAAIRVDPDVLLIDEVLAVGDERFSTKCTAWLADFKARGKTIVLVTHDTACGSRRNATSRSGSTRAASPPSASAWTSFARTRGPPAASRSRMPLSATSLLARSRRALWPTSIARDIAGLLPLLRLPLIGYVRQTGKIKGGYEDGWTDGALEFTL